VQGRVLGVLVVGDLGVLEAPIRVRRCICVVGLFEFRKALPTLLSSESKCSLGFYLLFRVEKDTMHKGIENRPKSAQIQKQGSGFQTSNSP
jgi:hypothetical protein